MVQGSAANKKASIAAERFGAAIRLRRQALKMTQDQLALVTGVGRRFLLELEGGKSSCQLGLSLLVAEALGLKIDDFGNIPTDLSSNADLPSPELPE
jgi:transcriptional regulator with XRE-family HTH domain